MKATLAPGFGLLGPLRLTAAGTQLPLGTPKQRAALAVLLISRNRVVSTDTLIDAIWGAVAPPAARATLHTYISNLRRLVGPPAGNAAGVLATAPPGYRLDVAMGDCDLDRFAIEKSAGIQAAAAGHFEQASRHLSAALAEWRGPALADLRDFSFADVFATALAEDRTLTQIALAESEIVCGKAESVIAELEQLTAEHPYREPLWTHLITACYLTERQSDALAAYRRLTSTLAEDLGIDPGPTVRALHQKILRQESLDIRRAAKATAVRAIRTSAGTEQVPGRGTLRDRAGRIRQLQSTITSIGRLADNDIVLDDDDVSRRHAVVIDTGNSYVITDLGSANGVRVQGTRIRPSTTLADGDVITICDYAFTFLIGG